jgi:hypothetical protein
VSGQLRHTRQILPGTQGTFKTERLLRIVRLICCSRACREINTELDGPQTRAAVMFAPVCTCAGKTTQQTEERENTYLQMNLPRDDAQIGL